MKGTQSTDTPAGGALLELTRMRLLLLVRQPEIVFWAFVFPVLLSIVLGLAFSRREAPVSRVVIVAAPGAEKLAESLRGSERLDVVVLADAKEIERQLVSGAADVVVTPGEALGLRFDETRAEAELARLRVLEALQGAAGRAPPVPIALAAEERTGNRYLDWFVPGLLGLSVMSTSIWAIGFAFVEARQRRLVRRFLVTPMRRSQYLLAHVLARLALLVLEVSLLLAFALLVLGVPFRGSIPAFIVLCVLGASVFAGFGVLLGSRVRSVEAAAGLINLSMMPMGLASGVFFAYERFPEVMHPIVRALPLAAFNDGLRAVMLEGLGLAAVIPEILVLGVWGLATFLIGLAIFRWS